MTLKERIDYKKCALVYKSQNSLGPQYLSHMFTPVSEVHGRNIRAAANCDLYKYHPVGTKNYTGKVLDTVVP